MLGGSVGRGWVDLTFRISLQIIFAGHIVHYTIRVKDILVPSLQSDDRKPISC